MGDDFIGEGTNLKVLQPNGQNQQSCHWNKWESSHIESHVMEFMNLWTYEKIINQSINQLHLGAHQGVAQNCTLQHLPAEAYSP
jgi:hypothetical protein